MEKTNICENCVKEIHLKGLVKNSQTVDICSFCKKNTKICDYESDQFYYLLKSLIRYHYDEWDYNHHFGGEPLYKLLELNDIFFNKHNFQNPKHVEILIELIDNFEPYENYTEGICLYAGYDKEGNQQTLLRALKNEIDIDLTRVIRQLKVLNYFSLESLIENRLKKFTDITKIKIEKNSKFYRARVGYSKKDFDHLNGGMEGKYNYIPFAGDQISSPPPFISQSGRSNRAGVSFLYCATDSKTAISEIRPHPGDKVSVGCFINQEELSIFNLTKDYLLELYRTDEQLDQFLYLNSINKLFQKTIPPSKKENYSITQIISDCIRKLGFDGILYGSSVSEGKNLVVFEPQRMKYVEDDKHLVRVEKVKYEYKKME